MSQFVRICSQTELPATGAVAEFNVDGRTICVANVGGSISVLSVVCPWHGYSFDVKTGISPEDPDLKAQVYESVVESGELRAKL